MISDLKLEDFEKFAFEFASKHLDDYNNSLEARGVNPGRKEINDPLWGTISLSGPEVAIIDSPLLQRLRLVRQLGVVHWVYPGAIHTRFEHSLGVLRQVQHLASAVNNLGTQEGIRDLIDPSKVNLLRLAALLHDVGHAAFSHVSEHAIDSLDTFSSLTAAFGQKQRAEQRSLSEIFAYYIVRSPAMRRMLSILLRHDSDYIRLNNNTNMNVDEITGKLSRAIIGQSIDDRLPLLHELISGPFDADKLDYFVRDAKNAGTPSLLDISRLVQKIALRELEASELPGSTGRDIRVQKKHILIGIKWSGISLLDELHLSRVLLYSKIYRHPKVVAVEQMIRASLVILANASNASAVLRLVYLHNDDELLAMSPRTLADSLSISLEDCSTLVRSRIEKASAIFADVRARRLFSKAFQLQRTYPGNNQSQDESQRRGLIEFREEIEHPETREIFRRKLITEVRTILELTGNIARSEVDLEGSIMVHPIGKTPGGTQIGRAYLITKTGQPLEFKDYLVNRTAWADSYLSDQPAGYIFSPPDIADIVFIAVELILRTMYSIKLPESAFEMSKRDIDNINSIKENLKLLGYYRDAPYDVRPEPSKLNHADIARTITAFAHKFELYQAPVERNGSRKNEKTDATLAARNWLRQFDNDDDVECAAAVLSAVRMITRSDTVMAIQRFIECNPTFEGALVVPFGSARDSGVIHSYFAADLQGKGVSECLNLDDAFQQHRGRPIIFLDDFVGSGGQSRDILAAGFGREDLRTELGEERNLFSANIQSFLRHAQLGFVFTAAWDSGITELNKILTQLSLTAAIFRHIGEDEIPFINKALVGIARHQVDQFIANSRLIGSSLIRSESRKKVKESDHDYEHRINNRSLGYGNRGMLLASPFNVPTQTFTPLWASGKVGGAEWQPILPRRKKK